MSSKINDEQLSNIHQTIQCMYVGSTLSDSVIDQLTMGITCKSESLLLTIYIYTLHMEKVYLY